MDVTRLIPEKRSYCKIKCNECDLDAFEATLPKHAHIEDEEIGCINVACDSTDVEFVDRFSVLHDKAQKGELNLKETLEYGKAQYEAVLKEKWQKQKAKKKKLGNFYRKTKSTILPKPVTK